MQIATSKVVFPNQYRAYNKHSLQHNYNPQNENNPQNQQTEIIYSKESENGCFYTNQTPRQNEHTIHVDKASHQPNQQYSQYHYIKEKISRIYSQNPG